MKAVIDRFEGDYAVVLVGDEEIKVDVHRTLQPKGTQEVNWLKVNFELDLEGTEKQKERISKLSEKFNTIVQFNPSNLVCIQVKTYLLNYFKKILKRSSILIKLVFCLFLAEKNLPLLDNIIVIE